ncbi:flavin monoamine oxidase family protein [Kitasatospora sp. NPDC004289]
MARTPYARLLRSALADRAAAERLRLPADEYAGFRDEALAEPDGPSRRALLARAAALGLGAAGIAVAPKARAATVADTAKYKGTPPRIAIVGAGISGLNAALTLADKGIPATVYEAETARVGGRMYSKTDWAGGQVSEYGAELIDTGHHEMLRLCQRFGLATTSIRHFSDGEQTLQFQGGYYPRETANAEFKQIWQTVKADIQAGGSGPTWADHNQAAVALDRMSVREWIETRVPGGTSSRLGALLDVAYAVEYGADTTAQSSYALLLMLSWQANPGSFNIWGGSDERYHVTGGNDQVPKAIRAALPAGTVQPGHTLLAVTRNADGSQTLTFKLDGGGTRTVTADHTILALPLSVLQQRVDLAGAGLDPLMKRVLTDMTMGYCTKLNMQTGSRPWTGTGPWPGVSSGECFSDQPFQQAWDVTKGQPGSGGILVQYHGGTPARALAPGAPFTDATTAYTRAMATDRLTQIDRLWPGTKAAWTGKATLSAWHLNPTTLGAYSCWPVGYLTTCAGYEGTAQGRLHLAGEHTSYDFQGYMEGGATEGVRAAQEVLTAIGA